MRFEPTHEQASISDVVRSIVESWKPQAVDEGAGGLEAIEKALSGGAWTGIGIPEQFGGSGFGLFEAALVIEELGAVLLPSALRSTISARRALLAGTVHSESTAEQSRCADKLAELADGGTGAVGFARPKHTTMIADGADCDLVVLFQNGVGMVGGPAEFGLEASESLDITRSHACVSHDKISLSPMLDERAAEWALAEARVLLAAELIGVARTALERSVAYASEREAFGKPIGSFQAIGHRLAESARFVDGARVMCHAAAWHADTSSDELPRFSRLALLGAARAVSHATDAAMQVHGAYGITWEAGIHWYQRRAHVAAHLLGDATELRRELAFELNQAAPANAAAFQV